MELTQPEPQDNTPAKYQRWYDQYENIADVMDISQKLPLFCQAHLGEQLRILIEGHLMAMELDAHTNRSRTSVNNIVEKSKGKARWYDTIPDLHKALTFMATLPPELLMTLNMQLAPLARYIKHDVNIAEVSADKIPMIFDTYLHNAQATPKS